MSFITNQQIQEAIDVREGIVASDGSGGSSTPWTSMVNAHRVAFFVQTTDGNTVSTVQLEEAEDDSGTSSQNLGDSVTIDAQTGVVEIPVSDLSDGYTHVRATVTTNGANPVFAVPALTVSYRP